MNDNLYYIHTIASLNFLVMLLGYFAHGIIKCLAASRSSSVQFVQRRGAKAPKARSN